MALTGRVAARSVSLALLAAAFGRVAWTTFHFFEDGRIGRHRVEAAWMVLAAIGLVALWTRRSKAEPLADASHSKAWPEPAALAVAVAASIVLYWPVITSGLFSDDFFLLGRTWQDTLRLSTWEHFRPVPLLIWKLLFPVGGAVTLHLMNIVLHAVNAWLTGRLVRRMGHAEPVAIAAALVYLTFPGAVEPVVWNSGVFDVMMVTFGLLYLHAALEGKSAWLTLVPLAAALLTKETAVMLPVIAAAIGCRTPVARRTLAFSVAITVAYVAMRKFGGVPLPVSQHGNLRYTIKDDLARPFAALAVPFTGAELARSPIALGVAPTVAIALLTCAYCARSAAGVRVAIGPLIVLAGMLPLWTFFFIDDDLQGSRYVYLPLVGWVLFLADLIAGYRVVWARRAIAAMVAVLVIGSGWAVRAHMRPWIEAAQVRDVVLRRAAARLAERPCDYPEFTNLPDSVKGAFVFRNGFPEAAHLPRRPATVAMTCVFTWRNGDFVRTN